MTKKHFEAFAQACACITNGRERQATAALIAKVCAEANPRFDHGRFHDRIAELVERIEANNALDLAARNVRLVFDHD